MYDASKLEPIVVGTKEQTTIATILNGTQDQFRGTGYWEHTKLTPSQIESAKKESAIEIQTMNGAKMVIRLPENNRVNPKSGLGLFKKTYGSYPTVGQKVDTKIDENGFNRIVIEK